MSDQPSAVILHEIRDLRETLLSHKIYSSVTSVKELQLFMEHHAFAVLDFMWLLKRLQAELCGCNHPWTPPQHPKLSRFINEIVIGEESDEDGNGGHSSHFELYLNAMNEVGSQTGTIRAFVQELKSGIEVQNSQTSTQMPLSVRQFVQSNSDLAKQGSVAEVAAAFCFGREDIIPDMFQRLLDGFQQNGVAFPKLKHYIERHIELDGDHHGPLALQLIDSVCDPGNLQPAIAAARNALKNRIKLWDGILSTADPGNSQSIKWVRA